MWRVQVFFDPAVKGTPLTWSNATVNYFTDQKNLSGILPQPSADAFVAAAFIQWTSIPTAAVASRFATQNNGTVNPSLPKINDQAACISVTARVCRRKVQSRVWYGPTSYASPARLLANGNWAAGAVDFFQFTAQANRTLSVIPRTPTRPITPSTP